MKRICLTSLAAVLFMLQPLIVKAAEPPYAKWGRLAVQETAKRYHIPIVDYLHVGRRDISPRVAEEVFKLWLRGPEQQFGVYVTIRFNPEDDQVLSIRFVETST